ncbi:hypothetical protein EVAR_40834_1 [Eumeta japonica]|uniref:Uncharacterized protein n=1 Tax=Eumeta variegata TaxID=151549 RepID=A0A4C1WIF0_EUMVA|nr:hypothetical protein EVAR_40834_1 [Eumeta japonica]
MLRKKKAGNLIACYCLNHMWANTGSRAAPGPTPRIGCVRPLSLFYSDASADGVEERSLAPRSRSHARLRRNATMSHAFSCVQPAFIDL